VSIIDGLNRESAAVFESVQRSWLDADDDTAGDIAAAWIATGPAAAYQLAEQLREDLAYLAECGDPLSDTLTARALARVNWDAVASRLLRWASFYAERCRRRRPRRRRKGQT
jgi:hypothetical protein